MISYYTFLAGSLLFELIRDCDIWWIVDLVKCRQIQRHSFSSSYLCIQFSAGAQPYNNSFFMWSVCKTTNGLKIDIEKPDALE